jgi:hypothetical protein
LGTFNALLKKEDLKKYGEYVKSNWDSLAVKYKNDEKALRYIDNVNAAMAGTVYSLAVREQSVEKFGFLDELQERRIKDLDDLANLSKDAQSIAIRITSLSMGGGLSFIQFASSAIGPIQIAYFILGAGTFYIALEILLRVFRYLNCPRIMMQIQIEKDNILNSQITPKIKERLTELLGKIQAISKDIYELKYELTSGKIETLTLGASNVLSSSLITGSSFNPPRCKHCGAYNFIHPTGKCYNCGQNLEE